MNLWAICTHKFRAQKKEFFYDFFGIIKNNVFFCINLCLFIALIYEKKNDHKFKGDLYPLFYGKKKAFFVGLIKNIKFFAINLCLFIALIYDKK